MKATIICLLVIFFQASFLPINFLLLLVLFLSLARENDNFFWPFLVGLGLDFISGRQVGLSSLAMLTVTFLIFLYKRKVATFHFLFLTVFSFFSACIFDLITLRLVSLKNSLILMTASFIFSLIVKYFDLLKWQEKENILGLPE